MTPRPWTPEEDARLFEMVAAGKSHSEIAREIGRTRDATLGRYHRILVKRGHIPNFRNRVSHSEDISPELLRNTTPKRAYRHKIPPPKVASNGVGFVMPMLAIVSAQRGPAIGILDVTGCRWPIEDDPAVIGGRSFCNAPQKEGRSYCAHHCRASKSTEPVKTWLKAVAA